MSLEDLHKLPTIEDYEKKFPWIRWREPEPITNTRGESGLACRYCIAIRGLKGSEVAQLPQTVEEFCKHMKLEHGIEAA